MRVGIVTNLNGRGLEHDATIVKALVERAGHEAETIQYNRPRELDVDLLITLEVAPRWAMAQAKQRWWIPNPEWARQETPVREFDRVLCKTQDAVRVFKRHSPRVVFVGFTARDRHDPQIQRRRRFLHCPGKSIVKGTDAILIAWKKFDIKHPLTIIGKLGGNHGQIPNVRRLSWLDDLNLQREQNTAMWHLCPSQYEGFGHSLHEGLSCGAIVARSEFPPMCEVPGVSIPAIRHGRMGLVDLCKCTPAAVARAVAECTEMHSSKVKAMAVQSRRYFERITEKFEAEMLTLLGDAEGRCYSLAK